MTKSLEGKHPGYYEAILQLRNISQDVIDFVEEEIPKMNLSISKVVELKWGGSSHNSYAPH
ncbi:hypothetical protein HYT55_00170 [Candidatus Woesearchaeota archaeon]|nr:hypothetical protein [Candidatus Woesearchaeota archaeon]